MKIGYIVRGKLYGQPFESEMYDDADVCDEAYEDYIQDSDYSEMKKYTAYIHFEELQ